MSIVRLFLVQYAVVPNLLGTFSLTTATLNGSVLYFRIRSAHVVFRAPAVADFGANVKSVLLTLCRKRERFLDYLMMSTTTAASSGGGRSRQVSFCLFVVLFDIHLRGKMLTVPRICHIKF